MEIDKENMIPITEISSSSRLSSLLGSNILDFSQQPTMAVPTTISQSRKQKSWGSIDNSVYANVVNLLNQLQEKYTFINSGDVKVFLDKNNALIDFLMEFKTFIDNYFSQSSASLEVLYSPDDPKHKELLIGIKTKLSVHEARPKRDQLNHLLLKSLKEDLKRYIPYVGINLEYI
jgi:hypothetical protein